jgi:hypothetical protein
MTEREDAIRAIRLLAQFIQERDAIFNVEKSLLEIRGTQQQVELLRLMWSVIGKHLHPNRRGARLAFFEELFGRKFGTSNNLWVCEIHALYAMREDEQIIQMMEEHNGRCV